MRDNTEIRLQRIQHYETLYREVQEALDGLEEAARKWAGCRAAVKELEAYYAGNCWKDDFAADEAGELPEDLRRGVLSEDGLYNLLDEDRRWRELLEKEVFRQ